MGVVNKPIVSVKQQNASTLAALNRQLELCKNHQGDFTERPVLTGQLLNTHLSKLDVTRRKLGALQTPARQVVFEKATTFNRRVVHLEGWDVLGDSLENEAVSDGQGLALGGRNYIFHLVTSEVAEDGSRISARKVAEHKLEHSKTLEGHASKPVGYLETRYGEETAEGDVYLISYAAGSVSFPSSGIKGFDPSQLRGRQRTEFDRLRLDAMIELHSKGLTDGGANEKNLVLDRQAKKVKNTSALKIERLNEETVDMEHSDLVAKLAFSTLLQSLGTDCTQQEAIEAYERAALYVRARSPVDRHAMRVKAKKHKDRPWKDVAEAAYKFSPSH